MTTARIGDITMYYEERGEGESLLLIPGLGTDVTDYRRIIDSLAHVCRVVAIDNRGAGRTDKPDMPYSVEIMAEDAARLLGQLARGPVHVLGHSMGGRIAIALALAHPDYVKSLILVSTGAKVAKPRRGGVRLLGTLTRRMPRFRSRDAPPQPLYAFLRQLEASGRYDGTARLADIHVPTLILHGTRDRLAPLDVARDMHRKIPGSRMAVFRGGHLTFFTHPREWVAAVAEFLSQNTFITAEPIVRPQPD